MESKPGSRNCKRSSTSFQPEYGILTRAKRRSHLQPQFVDATSTKLPAEILHSPRKKLKSQASEFALKDEDEASHFKTKDLRIKRVFSPNLIEGNRASDVLEQQVSDKEGFGVVHERDGDEVRKNSEETAGVCNSKPCLTNGYVGLDNDGENFKTVDVKSEDPTHSTPPDAEILGEGFLGDFSDGRPLTNNGRVGEGSIPNTERNVDSLSERRSVLKPCLKRKLYKAPGSIAYKRLLPYLLDSGNGTLQYEPYLKRENTLEKRPNVESNICLNSNTQNFQNGVNPCDSQMLNNSNDDTNSVAGDSGLKKNNVISHSSDDKTLALNGGHTKPQIKQLSQFDLGSKKLDEGNSFISSNISLEGKDSKLCASKILGSNVCENSKRVNGFKEESVLMTSFPSDVSCKPVIKEKSCEIVGHTQGVAQNPGSSIVSGGPSTIITIASDNMYDSCPSNKVSSNISLVVEDSKPCASKNSSGNVCEDINRVNDFKEEPVLMISLPSEVSCKPMIEEKSHKKVDSARVAAQNPGSSIVSGGPSTIAMASDNKYDSHPSNRVVRNPLLQLKSLSTTGSIGYRRMLPFLKDLTKSYFDDACASGNVDCPRLENGSETMSSDPPSSNSHNSLIKPEGFLSNLKPCNGNPDTLSMSILTTKETVCEAETNLISAGDSDKLTTSSILQQKQQRLQCVLEDKCKLEMGQRLLGADLLNDQAITSLNPAASHGPLTEKGTGFKDCTILTVNVSDNAGIPKANSTQPNSSCALLGNPSNIRRGILKRNPRGCRGLCSCLNCSSFRLHAERAFEFSRNQLRDAEEVTLDLIKELSYLRDMLDKSSRGANGDAGCYKVNKACKKASEAELMARNRFTQMNYELDIHCRIPSSQRPKVKFLHDNTEKRD